MRISSNIVYESGIKAIQEQQAGIVKSQQQFTSGRRVLTPEDDPIAAARGLEIQQSQSINKQYVVNADSTKSNLSAPRLICYGLF